MENGCIENYDFQLRIKLRGGQLLGNTGKYALSARRYRELGTLTGRARRARPDFVYKPLVGKVRALEAKYGSSPLTGPQRALRDQLGELFEVFRVTEQSAVNAAAAVGATVAGLAEQVTR